MEGLSKAEKDKMIYDSKVKQKKQYTIGKTIILIIAIVNLIEAVVFYIIGFDIFSILAQICLSIALYFGVVWARYLYAVCAILYSIELLYLLADLFSTPENPPFGLFLFFIYFIFTVWRGNVLIWNKNISEYLYYKKNG